MDVLATIFPIDKVCSVLIIILQVCVMQPAIGQTSSSTNESDPLKIFKSEVTRLVAMKEFEKANNLILKTSAKELAFSHSKQRDHSYLAVAGFAIAVPGVTSHKRDSLDETMMWIFPGTSDVFEMGEHFAFQCVAADFAETFNLFLDYYVGKFSKRLPGIDEIAVEDLVVDADLIHRIPLEMFRGRYRIACDEWKILSLETKLRMRMDYADRIEYSHHMQPHLFKQPTRRNNK